MKPRSILGVPAVYRAFTSLVVGNAWRRYLEEYVRPSPGHRILDLGCGPGDILTLLPPGVHYTGVDVSSAYIEAASRRFEHQGRFICQSVLDYAVDSPGSYDRVLAYGLLHHLDEEAARRVFALARSALRPGGRLTTVDGCFVPGQAAVNRWLLTMDRGQFVRDQGGYEALARTAFSRVTAHIRQDLLRIPYTHLILCCEP